MHGSLFVTDDHKRSVSLVRSSLVSAVFSARPAVLNLYCFIVPVTMIRIIIYIDLLLPFCSHLLFLSNYFTSTHMDRFTRERRRFAGELLSLGAQCHAGSAASSFNKKSE